MHVMEPTDVPEVAAAPSNSVTLESSTVHDTRDQTVLYLYSGPHRPDDGLGTYLGKLGIRCDYVDREANELHDLLDQDFWEGIWSKMSRYSGFLLSPPCSTFSAARKGMSGPQPLRGASGKEVYGLKSLKPEDKKKTREGNVLALRAHSTAAGATENEKPWIMEQPHEREDQPSMFKLDEFKELEKHPDVRRSTLDQCRYGCQFEKKTDLLANFDVGPELKLLCNHPPKWWRVPWNGKRIWASHPPLRGKQVAIEEHLWGPGMLRTSEPQGDYITWGSCLPRGAQQGACCSLGKSYGIEGQDTGGLSKIAQTYQ